MQELSITELKQVSGGSPLDGPIWDTIKALYYHFHQDNGGPTATWDNNGGYIG